MDPVILAAACAIGARSALFFPLGAGSGCAESAALGSAIVRGDGIRVGDAWAADVAEASRRFGVPERWIREVIHAESRGLASATSPAGAMGLMQVMPRTYAELRDRYGLGANPYDPRDSILAGAAYLREMHDRYGAPDFLAAYNAGTERLDEHLATGRPLPVETRRYVAAVSRGIAAGLPDQWTEGRPIVRIGVSADTALPAPDGDALLAIRIAADRDARDGATDGSGGRGTSMNPSGSESGTVAPMLRSGPNAAAPSAFEPPILRAIRQEDIEHPERRPAASSSGLFASKPGLSDAKVMQPERRPGDRARDTGPTTGAQDSGLFAPIRTAWTTR